jgi:DNA-binding LacI/PurR family transcriptional regulator
METLINAANAEGCRRKGRGIACGGLAHLHRRCVGVVENAQKVEKAATELGYSPNALASSLTTGRTKLIGLVSNNFHNPIFLEVFDLFTRGLQERGLRPLLVNLSDETDPANSIRMLRQYSVDGVVVASSTLPPGFAKAFRDAGVPVVHSFGRYASSPEVHVVGIDNVECGRMAARELVRRGYRDVAFLGGPESATSTQDRFRGFMEELARHPEFRCGTPSPRPIRSTRAARRCLHD